MVAVINYAHRCILVRHIEQETAGIVVGHFIRADNGVLVGVVKHLADFGDCVSGWLVHILVVLIEQR